MEHLPRGSMEAAADAMRVGDSRLARSEAQAVLAGRGAAEPERLRARFLLGVLALAQGQPQQASTHMSGVRQAEGHPLQPWAAWWEAQADLERGAPQTAMEECEAAVQKWPDFHWKDECELLGGRALAAMGRIREASDRFDRWAESHEEDPRREGLALSLARALETLGDRDAAVRRYRKLFLWHRLPTTGAAAEAGLRRLEASGEALPPVDDEDLYARACSLRAAGERDEAWSLYCQIEDRNPATGPGATALGKRIDEDRREFLRRAQRYEELGRDHAAAWERAPQAESAAEELYDAITSFARAGMWAEAVLLHEKGLELYPDSGRFRNSWERSVLLHSGAADYAAVVADYDQWMDGSKAVARDVEHRFLAAFYRYRAGRFDEARQKLDELLEAPKDQRTAAMFYRARVLERMKERALAEKDRNAILKNEPDSWYALVLRSEAQRLRPGPRPVERSGRWPGVDHPPPPPDIFAPPDLLESLGRLRATSWRSPGPPQDPAWTTVGRDADGRAAPPVDGWARVRIGASTAPDAAATAATRLPDPQVAPPRWSPLAGLDPGRGREVLGGIAEKHQGDWPELAVLHELVRCGLSDLAGPLLAEVHASVKAMGKQKGLRKRVQRWKASGSPQDPELQRGNVALSVVLTARDWLDAYAAAGWPAGVQSLGGIGIPLDRLPRTDPANRPAWSLLYPAAFGDHVWRAGWRDDVDPLLTLAIMRQESRYRHDAVSRAGALGLVQVMPATGAKVSAMLGELEFHPERLLVPAENIRIGSHYLGKLLERFPGQWPLAVASYNGGPHNVGRWLLKKRGSPLEDFVEEIAFSETRDYVKKVASFYVVYADLYGESAVTVGEKTGPDDPSVIDF
jgi:tetratricopeptide (TPR) repeat protein